MQDAKKDRCLREMAARWSGRDVGMMKRGGGRGLLRGDASADGHVGLGEHGGAKQSKNGICLCD